MVSIIIARAPEPDSGFISPVGMASTQRLSQPPRDTRSRRAFMTSSMAPLALNIPMAASMASR